jgi:MFS family permease
MPPLARGHYGREVGAWLLLAGMLGAVEGGVVSVIAKNAFAGAVSERWLNLAVAVLTGAPAFANVTSFLFSALSQGRHKIRMLVTLQVATASAVALVALAPERSPMGLVLLIVGALGARIAWAGVVTLRSTVWRANYARKTRANMAGKIVIFQAIMLAGAGFSIGLAMRHDERAYHVLYPIAAVAGLVGATLYSRMRMRGHQAMIAAERRAATGRFSALSPRQFWHILSDDGDFRAYLVCMMMLGFGNQMVNAPLVVMLRDTFGYGYLAGILITSTIPILLMPLSIPMWSRMLDRTHIVVFRSLHSWLFILTIALVLIGATAHLPILLWVAAVTKGIAFGGGVLGWNLGTHDFATDANASQYMGLHVTLTGVRGMIAPLSGVVIYEAFDTIQPGAGGWVFAVSLAIAACGALGFLVMRREMSRRERALAIDD